MTDVTLSDGRKLQAYPGGIEDQLVKFIQSLDNIVAILKDYPDVKIKIGGYTDKKGDDAVNKKLSNERAKAVKAGLEKANIGTQVPEAEGYGEEFAKIAESASDEERASDRKTSVRLIK